MRPYLEKISTKIGLVEWLKVRPLSSSPSTAKTNKQTKTGADRISPRISFNLFPLIRILRVGCLGHMLKSLGFGYQLCYQLVD
jgi:hypothetical protein